MDRLPENSEAMSAAAGREVSSAGAAAASSDLYAPQRSDLSAAAGIPVAVDVSSAEAGTIQRHNPENHGGVFGSVEGAQAPMADQFVASSVAPPINIGIPTSDAMNVPPIIVNNTYVNNQTSIGEIGIQFVHNQMQLNEQSVMHEASIRHE